MKKRTNIILIVILTISIVSNAWLISRLYFTSYSNVLIIGKHMELDLSRLLNIIRNEENWQDNPYFSQKFGSHLLNSIDTVLLLNSVADKQPNISKTYKDSINNFYDYFNESYHEFAIRLSKAQETISEEDKIIIDKLYRKLDWAGYFLPQGILSGRSNNLDELVAKMNKFIHAEELK